MSDYPRQIAFECANHIVGEEPLAERLRWCEWSVLKLVPGNTPEELWPTVWQFQLRLLFVPMLEPHELEQLAMDILTEFVPSVAGAPDEALL